MGDWVLEHAIKWLPGLGSMTQFFFFQVVELSFFFFRVVELSFFPGRVAIEFFFPLLPGPPQIINGSSLMIFFLIWYFFINRKIILMEV